MTKKSHLESARAYLSELFHELRRYRAEFVECQEDNPRREELLARIGEIEKEILRHQWALLSETEIKEYLTKRGLKVDPTKYAPAKKAFGVIFSMFMPGADNIWKGVCPHCGWGISAIHVIGSFRALTKCEECGKLALLDREAERFFAVVQSEPGF